MRTPLVLLVVGLWLASPAQAFIEAPHSVGRICTESTNIMVVEVARIDTNKNLIIYNKIYDLKGKHNEEQIKHNIGRRGSHPREWQAVMAWAKVGRRAVFFHNGNASLTCIDRMWYQCFREGAWWAMSHAEPFVLRTYCGSPERLEAAVADILKGKEVIVPAMVVDKAEEFHLRTGKIHRIRASLKLLDYDPRRDFVAIGDFPDEPEPRQRPASGKAQASKPGALAASASAAPRSTLFRAININGPALMIGGEKWEAHTAADCSIKGQRFNGQNIKLNPDCDNATARMIRSCVYGKDAGITLRNVPEGQYDVFVYVWEDNHAQIFDLVLNGKKVVSRYKSGPAGRWARLGPWRTTVTDGRLSLFNPTQGHANLSGVEVHRVEQAKRASQSPSTAKLSINTQKRQVAIPCVIAPRKLPHLDRAYPIEVIATWPDGQKAHETVVTFRGIKPSEVDAALRKLGLKPGQPARGENARPTGPEVRLYLELPGPGGKQRRVSVEETLIAKSTGKPLPRVSWYFTGSVVRQPDPEKDDREYGADITGTLAALFPVTDDVVLQSSLTMNEESSLKLETNTKLLPKEGTPVKLIIEAK